jgi:hypothetical protein
VAAGLTVGACPRLIGLAELPTVARLAMVRQWEYETLEPPTGPTMRETADPKAELNRLGAEGWELAGTVSYEGGGAKLLLFKRPVTDE